MIHSRADQAILDQLGIEDHDGLIANVSRDDSWLDHRCVNGQPADWCLEWTEITVDGHGEAGNTDHYLFGQFHDLLPAITAALSNPSRNPGTLVELDVSAWAVLYRSPLAAAA
ncbi:hypothetical protein [Rhodococcoides fascians]|uniref:hypothetical protein n=1 Tax=Rhodococcoides fascians TaxID=1828 RepID=UPI00050C9F93|nr:hypothetical protein [Rhodococcus fascians]